MDDVYQVTQIFLTAATILIGTLAVSSTEGLKFAVSLVCLLLGIIWYFCMVAVCSSSLVFGLLIALPVKFVFFALASTIVHRPKERTKSHNPDVPMEKFSWKCFLVSSAVLVAIGIYVPYWLVTGGWLVPPIDNVSEFGTFSAYPRTEWIDDEGTEDRSMRLLDDFSYIDPFGKAWTAPKDTKIDGASIPKVFWSIVGSPYTGDYRKASIVHDFGCDSRTETSEDVHRMFYYACRCGGVSEVEAKVLYTAVYRFGPAWLTVYQTVIQTRTLPDGQEETITVEVPVIQEISKDPAPDATTAEKLREYIEKKIQASRN